MMDAAHQQYPPPPPSYELAAAPTTSTMSSSRPMLGFPLGTALLLLVIFCLSGVLSCCYHWDKIQALRRRRRRRGGGGEEGEPTAAAADEENGAVPAAGMPPSPYSKPTVTDQYAKQEMSESLLPVIMPGDRIPKFIAWPCPCDHLPAFAGAAATPPTRASDVEPPPPPPDDAHQLDKLTTVEDQGLSSSPTALQAPAPAVVPPHASLLCAATTPIATHDHAHDQEEPTLVVQLPYSNRPAAS